MSTGSFDEFEFEYISLQVTSLNRSFIIRKKWQRISSLHEESVFIQDQGYYVQCIRIMLCVISCCCTHTLERVSCEETALLRRTAGCSCETCPESVPACCCRVCRQETHVAASSQDQRATSSAFGSSPRVVCQSTLPYNISL